MRTLPSRRFAVVPAAVLLASALIACGGDSAPATGATVTEAIASTVEAESFVLGSEGVEVVYHGRERVKQVEHGQSVSSNDKTPVESTTTKLFIGDQYFESHDRAGDPENGFTVSPRCAGDDNAASVVLAILRLVDRSNLWTTDDGFTFSVNFTQHGSTSQVSGQGTVADRLVRTLALTFSPGYTRTFTFDSYDSAPAVETPARLEGNATRSC